MSEPVLPHLGKYLRDRYERLDPKKDAMVTERLDKLADVHNLPTASGSWWRNAVRGAKSSWRRLADKAALMDTELDHVPSTFAVSKGGSQAGAAAAGAAREAGLVTLARLIGERGSEATFDLLALGLPQLGAAVARKTALPRIEDWAEGRARTLAENNRRVTGLGSTTFDIDAARAARGGLGKQSGVSDMAPPAGRTSSGNLVHDMTRLKKASIDARVRWLLEKYSAGWGESISNAFDNALTSYAPSSVVSGVNSVRKSLGFREALSNEARAAAAPKPAAPAPSTPAQAAAPKPASPAPAFQAPKPASAMPKTTAPAVAPAPATPKAPSFGKKPGQK